MRLTRRSLLVSASVVALAGQLRAALPPGAQSVLARPLPLSAVRLKPSIWATALETNSKYLLSLDPDRLLHNFRPGGGASAQGRRATAGGKRGHRRPFAGPLSVSPVADARPNAATPEMLRRVRLSWSPSLPRPRRRMATAISAEQPSGATARRSTARSSSRRSAAARSAPRLRPQRRLGAALHLAQGPCRPARRDRLGGNAASAADCGRHGDYLGGVVEPISDEQMQRLLDSEHGGLNETYAETFALTGDPRWLAVAERLRHSAVLDPLTPRAGPPRRAPRQYADPQAHRPRAAARADRRPADAGGGPLLPRDGHEASQLRHRRQFRARAFRPAWRQSATAHRPRPARSATATTCSS